MAIKFSNNASTKLASGITNVATTLDVLPGTGALFPTLDAGDYFYCTLADTSGNMEIVKVTARNIDTLTISRAQESTTARAFAANSIVEQRFTAGSLSEVLGTVYATDGETIARVSTTRAVTPNNLVVATVSRADDLTDGSVLSIAKGGTGGSTAATARASLGLGSAAVANIVTVSSGAADAGKVPALDASGKLDVSSFDAIPAGTVLQFAGSTAPSGSVFCDGALLNRVTYARLFAAIGTTYGAGDGSTTFAVPDFRGAFLRGLGSTTTSHKGTVTHTSAALGVKQGDAIRNITGSFSFIPRTNANGAAVGYGAMYAATDCYTWTAGRDGYVLAGESIYFDSSRVVATDVENRPVNYSVNYVIKY